MIHKFGIRHRTAQELVLRVMSAYYVPRPFQYTTSGVPKAIAGIKNAIIAGHIHFARLDIKEFFPSFVPAMLVHELPCPQGTVEGVVSGQLLKVHMDHRLVKSSYGSSLSSQSIENFLMVARLGNPQGSSCSPIVSSFCVSRLVWPIMPGVILTNYANDFLLLAKSAALLASAIGKLINAVAELPGGYFELKLKTEATVGDGCTFLGHCLRLTGSGLETSPTAKAFDDLSRKLGALDMKLSVPKAGGCGTKDDHKCLARMVATVNGWTEFFAQCDDIEEQVSWANLMVLQRCKQLGFDLEVQVKKSIDSSMGYDFDGYS